ncbi:FAD-dependent oxidoreductase [Streptomyces gobiensis]|uniref:FAD-dependent oxidoreductase n=1 Tax=Streptomyces gobiensis TaxID=2875706 RepID=UPI001E3D039F|nr:FAD-dependent oxidoreductase [Streptomyces gobiensis]UGY92954.1 FAD-dependent oxidoreductase [Streptomyces gobiensis]
MRDIDLLIVGGGPAGCAAAVMAASLGMRSTLLEADTLLCRKLLHIPALSNVLGGFTSGPALAEAIAGDVTRSDRCHIMTGHPVSRIDAGDEDVTVTLAPDQRLTAPHVVVATGVTPAQPAHADWITAPEGLAITPLWEASPEALTGRTALILGADRPLDTLLRSAPDLDTHLLVVHPPEDTYKTAEARGDSRVELIQARHVTVYTPPESPQLTAEITSTTGETLSRPADHIHLNLGTRPHHPTGPFSPDELGYCPPARQHPRIHIAGDLRSARCQRIMTAMGSGSEAALHAYYNWPESSLADPHAGTYYLPNSGPTDRN